MTDKKHTSVEKRLLYEKVTIGTRFLCVLPHEHFRAKHFYVKKKSVKELRKSRPIGINTRFEYELKEMFTNKN